MTNNEHNLICCVAGEDGLEEVNASSIDFERLEIARYAVRAVLLNEVGEILLQHYSKYGLYALPGGGIDNDESEEQALARELVEETGYKVSILNVLGCTYEFRPHGDVIKNTIFIAKVNSDRGERSLMPNEIEDGLTDQWLSLSAAEKLVAENVPLLSEARQPDVRCKRIFAFLKENEQMFRV